VKTGYTEPPESSTLKVVLTATITPKDQVPNLFLGEVGLFRAGSGSTIKHPTRGTAR
jgi:hypothetical protein